MTAIDPARSSAAIPRVGPSVVAVGLVVVALLALALDVPYPAASSTG